MKVDLGKLTDALNASAEKLKEAAETLTKNPGRLMDFIPSMMNHYQELRSMGINSLEDVKASIANANDAQNLRAAAAIDHFLKNAKEAQEKAGVMGATLFGSPQFKELTTNLEQVKKSLTRGQRVEDPKGGSAV